ncbi:MAG: DUF4159 domain-containing protein [Gemmatimonas sp.]
MLQAAILLLVVSASGVEAQRGGGRNRRQTQVFEPNVLYDGRFTYVRIRYEIAEFGGFGGGDVKWAHDYPRGERHFTKVMTELSTIRTHTAGSAILTLDDPLLTKYPIAFITEPGFWRPNDLEIAGLRNYVTKGGFVVFDDFAGEHWMNFEEQLRKVFPKLRPIPLTLEHPVFDSFYKIKSIDLWHPYYRGLKAVFYGLFEDNDPRKRLLGIANYNFDMSELWEFSDEGMFPVDQSNEAYKIGVNYIIYALTR